MAEAIVSSLLKLIPDLLKLLKEEWDLGSEAKAELENLKDLIGAIGRFLKKANSKELIDEDLKASMKRMRKFLYDCEDAINDFVKRGNREWDGLCLYIYYHYNRRTFSSEAKSIRKMVQNYKTTLETSNTLSADHAKSSSACHQSLSIAFSVENDDELVGIETAKDQLVRWLTVNNSTPKMIFVHGAQGVGKTSLVGAVLRDQNVRRHFNRYVWIKDLRSCESVEDKAAALMKANVEIWNPKEEHSREILELGEVFRQLWNFKWALILDDAGSAHVFEFLRCFLAQTRPSVLVTTRDSSLASISSAFLDFRKAQSGGIPPDTARNMYDFCNFKLDVLSEVYSSTLFCQKMFLVNDCPPVIKDASKSILEKCGGLPLAILATRNLLIGIQNGLNGTPQSVEWQKLSCRLGEELLSKRDTSGLIQRMTTLRMDHLHDVHACLFYLSIFPLDLDIRCSTLMWLWMAERFIKQKGTKPVQKIAEETIKKLIDHNLIQEGEKTSYGMVRTCKVHNLLHQIIISKSKDDEFAMIVADLEEEWPETIWRLSFHKKVDSMVDSTRVRRLRSLLFFKDVDTETRRELLGQVKRLNVLNLQAPTLISFPEKIFSLIYLRYLSLRGTRVDHIPENIEKLAYLETLDLKDTRVSELPNGILKLKALRHLLVNGITLNPVEGIDPKVGVNAPSRLGDLTSLQNLYLIKLNQVERCTSSGDIHGERLQLPEELRKLGNLRRLGISNLTSKDAGLLCSSIEKLKKLEVLRLIAATDAEVLDLSNVDMSKASSFLQRVHLTGNLATLPEWILSPTSLVKLVLKRSQLTEDSFRHLKKLYCLKHLELQQAFNVSTMTFEASEFQQLCFLGLDRFDKLRSIRVDEGALPNLESLSLARCELLTTEPQVIIRPKKLNYIKLRKMPDIFVIAMEFNEEVHKRMKVEIEEWESGGLEEVLKPRRKRAGRLQNPI
ncbi:hypothetical protein BT93_L4573 [Corymbia citriodora subsp. variegata]|uniref:NB-ARC domain-containing protein n=1 Tax=Corymbia citriodora subsp. variegata TaxID=360336 RepID=A0A8T0D1B0_CORYI|nr:hypothetical protein BT93_L4573 [Corymbia citriodora subsp. variegata]